MIGRTWPGWLLAFVGVVVAPLPAQERPPPLVELRENYPNPFFPATTIPFSLSPELCERGHQPLVSLKVYNVLAQVVATPVLLGAAPVSLNAVPLECGSYEAWWDGRVVNSKRQLTPGVYYAQLIVDSERHTLKMIARP